MHDQPCHYLKAEIIWVSDVSQREQELFTVALCGVQFGVTVRALNLARVKMTSVMRRADRKNEPCDLWSFRSAFKNDGDSSVLLSQLINLFSWREQVLFRHPQVPGTKGQSCEEGLSVCFYGKPTGNHGTLTATSRGAASGKLKLS